MAHAPLHAGAHLAGTDPGRDPKRDPKRDPERDPDPDEHPHNTGATVHARCLCGAVALRARGPLFALSHCFCTQCQRQHGAAAGSYGNVASDGVVIERGAALITHFAKSAAGYCGFCSVCGSMLYSRGAATQERVALALGALDPPYTGSVTQELFAEHKPRWLGPA